MYIYTYLGTAPHGGQTPQLGTLSVPRVPPPTPSLAHRHPRRRLHRRRSRHIKSSGQPSLRPLSSSCMVLTFSGTSSSSPAPSPFLVARPLVLSLRRLQLLRRSCTAPPLVAGRRVLMHPPRPYRPCLPTSSADIEIKNVYVYIYTYIYIYGGFYFVSLHQKQQDNH